MWMGRLNSWLVMLSITWGAILAAQTNCRDGRFAAGGDGRFAASPGEELGEVTQVANPGVLDGGVDVVQVRLAVEVARVDRSHHHRESQGPDFDVPQ
jgi:hypothetical protein